MKTVYKQRYLAGVLLLLASAVVLAGGNAEADSKLALSDALAAHPRLLWLAGEEVTVREGMRSNAELSRIHEAILAECGKILTKSLLERKLIGRRLLDVSREAVKRLLYLSYAWRMEQDARYLQRAEQELLRVCSFSDWNPSHFLDVAEMTTAVAIAYDWLYPALSPETRNMVRLAIRYKGIEPSLDGRYNNWLKTNTNWNQVCNAGMALGAMAIFEDDPANAKRIIVRSVQSVPLAMAEYEPDGSYPEGYGYWGYGTSYNVLLISALERAFGSDFELSKGRGFARTGEYMMHMTGPTGLSFNFSDSGAKGSLNLVLAWFAARYNNPLLSSVNEPYFAKASSIASDRMLALLPLWALLTSKTGAGNATDSGKVLSWMAQGRTPVAFLRSAWERDAAYVAIKGGSVATNHAHMDVGAFVMDMGGIRWAMDFGMQDYESLESKGIDLFNMKQDSPRWKVFRYGNLQHNTLAFDNALQRVAGKARIDRFSDQPAAPFAIIALDDIYKDQVQSISRGVALQGGSTVLVRDEVSAGSKETVLSWTMLSAADVQLAGDGSAVLSKDGQKLNLQVSEPAGVVLRTWSTQGPNGYDAANPGTTLVGFEYTLKAGESRQFEVRMFMDGVTAKTVPFRSLAGVRLKDW